MGQPRCYFSPLCRNENDKVDYKGLLSVLGKGLGAHYHQKEKWRTTSNCSRPHGSVHYIHLLNEVDIVVSRNLSIIPGATEAGRSAVLVGLENAE